MSVALAGIQPAAIAWDLADGGAGEYALAQSLRVHPRLCHLPFILYTAALAMGVTSFVIKPVGGQASLDILCAMCPDQAKGPILVVDDDPQAIELYKSVAAKVSPDCSIRTAKDGAEALELMAEETPGVVVLDLTMPTVDGFQVLEWMRAKPPTRCVPALVLSGRILTDEDIKRLEQHALATFQSKDILSESETADALRQVLSGDEALSQPTSALVKRAVAYLQQNYQRALSRQEIAQAIGVTENYLSRIFRQELGLSPWDYLNRSRIKQAKELLRRTNESVMDIALQVGFENPAYFTRVFTSWSANRPASIATTPHNKTRLPRPDACANLPFFGQRPKM